MIEFKELNLAQPWPALAPMDIIFMRNVLIYFDTETKKAIFTRVHKLMKPDGCLFLGGAETPMGVDDALNGSRWTKAHITSKPRRHRRG